MFEHFFIPGLTDNYWVLEKNLQTIHRTNESQIYKEFKQLNKSPNVATKSGQIISTAYEMPNLGNYQRHAVLSQNEWARHPSQDNCYCLKINISARWTSIYCRWGCKHIQPWDRTAHIPQKSLKISRLYWNSLSYSWMYIQKKWGQGAKERAAPHVFAAHCGNPEKSSTEVLADRQQINKMPFVFRT